MSNKILIAYYSHSGNTKSIANQIQSVTGGDLFEIQPVNPYPASYNQCVEQAKREINSGYKPELSRTVQGIEEYDVIFVGSPNWWSTLAPPVVTFLASYDLSGKTVVPFCTHGGGGQARCLTDVVKLTPKSTHAEGIAISGNNVNTAKPEIEKWLRRIKF
ncbi:MAG: NAD(P)H-dependent oxidoreductase [Planctomycetaceae bacterium]|jgi:flavodoxin|nr:NAD(P)H-dependent oxidoreductase [Planctomycetaceae bacterium]